MGFPLLLGLFVYSQIRAGDKAMIPPQIMKQRSIFASSAFAFFQMAGVFV